MPYAWRRLIVPCLPGTYSEALYSGALDDKTIKEILAYANPYQYII